ncbi:MAG TPA: VWA domain-containing protein [Chloroflexia bacterium]|nr:VWA domain-containing protein [Chloroflexia bacterium]
MSTFRLLHPLLLAGALLLLPLLLLGVRRLMGLSRRRRVAALALQAGSALLLLAALAEPVRITPDLRFSLVVVVDVSDSPGPDGRDTARALVRDLQAAAGPTASVQVVTTAGEAAILPPAPAGADPWAGASRAGGDTNLAAGLDLAGSLLPAGGRRRVVLVSDGWETQGQAAEAAARLRGRGVDLQVLAVPALGPDEVIAEHLALPAYARVGDNIPGQVRIFSTRATTATLTVQVDGAPAGRRTVLLAAGENAIPLDQRATTAGFHAVEVSVAGPADSIASNNVVRAGVVVKAPPHVLVVEDRPGEATALVTALTAGPMTVDVRGPAVIPPQVAGIDTYDSIILHDVAATSLTLDQQRTLQDFVRRAGRGLVVIGGRTSYARGGYVDSVLEEVLPLSSQPAPRPEHGSTALLLVMDRSASMLDRGGGPGVNKFMMAKQAARLAVDALRPGDSVGVLTFDMANTWSSAMQTISGPADQERIKDQITAIEDGGGTAIFPAVREAASTMARIDAPTKHVVLLTDGQENGRRDYGPVLDALRAAGGTLSTIGIGEDADKTLLTLLAHMGGGRYYFTERVDTLPQIVFKEVDVALKEALREGPLQPHLGAASPLLRGVAGRDLPLLGGYDVTVAKPDALVSLATESGDPLLAQWSYGRGRAVAFTSSTDAEWGAGWRDWNAFGRFWGGVVRWTMPSAGSPLLQPTVEVRRPLGGDSAAAVAHLVVESLQPDNSFADLATITAAVRDPAGAVRSALLTQTAPGRYEADLPVATGAASEVRVTRQDAFGVLTETAAVSAPPAAELLHAGTNDRLLQGVTGGAPYLRDAAQALDPTGLQAGEPAVEPLWPALVAAGLLLLLASVAVRRLAGRRGRA